MPLMLQSGTFAPDFALLDQSGDTVTLAALCGRPAVLAPDGDK